MQNRYVGDIGDFGKYVLLNTLCKNKKLGVVWYLTDPLHLNEKDRNDGKHVRYLNLSPKTLKRLGMKPYTQKEWRKNQHLYEESDPELYRKLRDIVEENKRDVREIKKCGVLTIHPRSVFCGEKLSFATVDIPCNRREVHRKKWLQNVQKECGGCDIVFLDPDNGLQIPSAGVRSIRAPKFVRWNDLPYFDPLQSLIVIHHMGMQKGGVNVESHRRCQDLQRELKLQIDPIVLRWHRFLTRLYFIIPAQRHLNMLNKHIDEFLKGPFGIKGHFSRLN